MDPSQTTGNQDQFAYVSDDDYENPDHHHDANAEYNDGQGEEEEFGTADQAIALEIFDLINHQDIWNLASLQSDVKYILTHNILMGRLEDTRMAAWTLGDFCNSSGKVLADLTKQYEQHAKMILEMKKDLDVIFKRTRTIKAALYSKYPAIKAAVMSEMVEES